jgi:acetyl esterase/lipase
MNWREEILDCDAAGPVPVRVYGCADAHRSPPLVLHLHGGRFLGGSLASGEPVAVQLARAGAIVVSADYTPANEKPFPSALHFAFDVLSALRQRCAKLADRKSFLFVAGEEAGGNLAAGLSLMARDQMPDTLRGQILLSPMLNPCMATESFRAETASDQCRWADGWNRYLGSSAKSCHPYAAPAFCRRLAGVAPALVITAQDDPMHDESLDYARRLREAGVPVRQHILTRRTGWPGSYTGRTDIERDWEETMFGDFAAFFHETGALPN